MKNLIQTLPNWRTDSSSIFQKPIRDQFQDGPFKRLISNISTISERDSGMIFLAWFFLHGITPPRTLISKLRQFRIYDYSRRYLNNCVILRYETAPLLTNSIQRKKKYDLRCAACVILQYIMYRMHRWVSLTQIWKDNFYDRQFIESINFKKR